MACVDFDVADYVDELTEDQLVRELKRRHLPFSYHKLEDIKDRLQDAFQRRDVPSFHAALAMLEHEDDQERRRRDIELKYFRAMGRLAA